MARSARGETKKRLSTLRILLSLVVVTTIVLLAAPVLKRLLASTDTRSAIVERSIGAVSQLCLADQKKSETNKVQINLSTQLSKAGSDGVYTEEQVNKSVDLALGDASLLEERQRVRSCMAEQLPQILEANGLLKLTKNKFINPGPFIVFFDWSKSTLSPQASSIINNAAGAYHAAKSFEIVVHGFSEPFGEGEGRDFNSDIGEDRARAVYQALIERGVPENRMSFRNLGSNWQPGTPKLTDGDRRALHRAEINFVPLVPDQGQ